MAEASGPTRIANGIPAIEPVVTLQPRRHPLVEWWPLIAFSIGGVLAAGMLMQSVRDLERRTHGVEIRLESMSNEVRGIAVAVGATR